MSDYRTMFDKENLGAWDLAGKDRIVTISAVAPGKVGHGNKASKKPIISLEGKTKKFVCNITNGKTIAQLYGPDTRKWIGKKIIIYPTIAQFGGQDVDAIRVRPRVPEGASETKDFDPPDPEKMAEMRAKQDDAAGRPRNAEDRQRMIDNGEDPDA